ncbi:MAG: hypothetical protein ACYCR4_13705 [Acidimicrobiales bacterium]
MDEFTIDDERFAAVLAERAALETSDVAELSLDSWGGETATVMVSGFVAEMLAEGALLRAVVADEPMDLVIYSHDDDSGVGYMVAVRPANAARASKLIPSGAQIASYIEDTDDLVGRDDDEMLGAVGPDALREVLVACAAAGNDLVPVMRCIADDNTAAVRAVTAIQTLLSKDTWSGADDMQEIAEILARNGYAHS